MDFNEIIRMADHQQSNISHKCDTAFWYDDYFTMCEKYDDPNQINMLEKMAFSFGWYCGWNTYNAVAAMVYWMFNANDALIKLHYKPDQSVANCLSRIFTTNLEYYNQVIKTDIYSYRPHESNRFEAIHRLVHNEDELKRNGYTSLFYLISEALSSSNPLRMKYWVLSMVYPDLLYVNLKALNPSIQTNFKTVITNVSNHAKFVKNPHKIQYLGVKEVHWFMEQCVKYISSKQKSKNTWKRLWRKNSKESNFNPEYEYLTKATIFLLLLISLIEHVTIVKHYNYFYTSDTFGYSAKDLMNKIDTLVQRYSV